METSIPRKRCKGPKCFRAKVELRVEIRVVISVGTYPVIIISSTYISANKEEE